MCSGANDQAKTLQARATMVGNMLHCIQDDHMFLEANSFNRPTMKFFQQLRNLARYFDAKYGHETTISTNSSTTSSLMHLYGNWFGGSLTVSSGLNHR